MLSSSVCTFSICCSFASSTTSFVLGVIIGVIGLIGMGINYPVYKKILVRGKQKYAFEIMQLAKEISDK